MNLLTELPPDVSVRTACELFGVSRATFYRLREQSTDQDLVSSATPSRPHSPPVPPRRLSDDERLTIIKTLHSEEFRDQPPRQVVGTLLSRGQYLCSERTMYRILSSLGEANERREQRLPIRYEPPFLKARAPHDVWVWDITALPGPRKGEFFYLYSVMDLYSRYVVAWQVAHVQCGAIAERLFFDACMTWDIVPASLCVHSDRGTPMTSHRLTRMFEQLGVATSFSRPRVSDDNPHIESLFKTLKYQPDFPDRFRAYSETVEWAFEFFGWYNNDHIHSGIANFTPANLFHGQLEEVIAVRQQAYNEFYANHAERFVNGPPLVKRPPELVTINPADLIDPNDPEYLKPTPALPTRRANSSNRPSPPQLLLPIS